LSGCVPAIAANNSRRRNADGFVRAAVSILWACGISARTSPLKSVKDGAPSMQTQYRNSESTYESDIILSRCNIKRKRKLWPPAQLWQARPYQNIFAVIGGIHESGANLV
jgi:hypothetical protein